MSFSFGSTPKTATGFTLPTSTAPTASSGGFSFGTGGAGDPQKPTGAPVLFGATPAPAQAAGLSFGTPAAAKPTQAQTLSFAAPVATSASAPNTGLSFSLQPSAGSAAPAASTAAAPQFSFGPGVASTTAKTSALSFTPIAKTSLSTTPSSAAPSLGASGLKVSFQTPTTSAVPTTSLAASTAVPITITPVVTTTAAASTAAPVATTTITTSVPVTGSLTFNQLEDLINKWTIDLEEQNKVFVNQAKQLNAWDMLLISNGEKVLNLNNGIERVKQQQQQLDQELDFVLAQQKELEELIVPLEKELSDIPITDQDRNHTYQLAEKLDSQLKQMSEDLKETIENLNESNKSDELADPVTQISRIMNAHMNSLQWIDRQTQQISSHLEQISKLQDLNRRNNMF